MPKKKDIDRPYRVLSLDGGGMRGVYTAAFLDRLVTYFAKVRGVESLDLGKGFDLITGTSTGAIVACALAVGKPLSDVVKLYREHGPSIFPRRISGIPTALRHAIFGSSYLKRGDTALRAALHDVLGDMTMKDVFESRAIGLSIPSVLMGSHRSWVFKKTTSSGQRDDKYPLVDVCMATTAAPIFRSLAAIDDPNANHGVAQVFADGGLWANNPVLVGLIDALHSTPQNQPIQIFSLGTCSRPEGEHVARDAVHRSMFGWKLGADVAPLSISAQEFAFDNMARMLATHFSKLGKPVSLVRFPKQAVPAQMLAYLNLDDARPEAMERLVSQASADADMTKSACDDANNNDGQLIKRLFSALPEIPKFPD